VRTLDPVTLAVINGRLVQIADEMDATLYRSAFNPIIAEAHDACHGLYHAETGATLVQGTSGLPIFVGAMAFAVKAVIDKVARDGGLPSPSPRRGEGGDPRLERGAPGEGRSEPELKLREPLTPALSPRRSGLPDLRANDAELGQARVRAGRGGATAVPVDPLHPGDTYLFNDPYDGGTHLNDFRLVRPLMRAGKVFAWIASVGHWLDIGGAVPGNYNPKATESFQEGVRFPPVKLIRGGVLQQDIVDILAANSRVPQSNWGDLNGQLNALDLGERRLHALLDEYGDDTIAAALAALTARAEELMRANIRALPDGTYAYDDFLDNDGVTDVPLRIAVDLTIRDDRMTLDFARSAPPCDGPLNIARSTAIASCYVALKHIFVDVPSNAGCLAPIDFVIPDTTLLAVSAPRPVAGYTETILRVIDVIFGAFAKVAPDRAHGSPFATINALSLAGWRADRRRWIMFCFFGGGLGGNPETDGLNHSNNPISTATIPPVEVLESLYPVMFTQWALRPDSGGPGRHRGGLGAIYEVEALAEGGADVFLIGERGKFPPFGVNGGRSAALNRFVYQTDAGEATPKLVSKITDIAIRQGQKVRLETPGGGGFGDPATREPDRVARDVRLGYVSREAALREYKVVLRDDGSLDDAATAKERAAS
jgi:N-methylhydantoinase B